MVKTPLPKGRPGRGSCSEVSTCEGFDRPIDPAQWTHLGYFPVQPVVPNWSIKGCGMCFPVRVKEHIEDPLLFIGKSSLCGNSGFL